MAPPGYVSVELLQVEFENEQSSSPNSESEGPRDPFCTVNFKEAVEVPGNVIYTIIMILAINTLV